MSFLESINSNSYEVIVAAAAANFIAQLYKFVSNFIRSGTVDIRWLVTTGGMPSSHSSTVVAMCTSIGLIEGFESMVFAVALCVAVVVMYDAAGVRRSAGKQAKVLNQMMEELFSKEHKFSGAKLKELLGHSPVEVLVGALLGAAVSLYLRQLILTVA